MDDIREQFEDYMAGELGRRHHGFERGNTVLLARTSVGDYVDPTINDRWFGYVAGWQARNAEVQALRKGLALISRLYDSPESDDAVLLREAVDIATCATEDADAVLPGRETTDE